MAYYLKAPDGRELAYSSKEAAIAAMDRALKKYPDWERSDFSLEMDEAVNNPKANQLRAEGAQLAAKADSIAKANSKPGMVEGWAGDIFPSAVEKGSAFGPWDAVTDAAGYMFRAPGAILDAVNPYSTRTADDRYGIRESLEDSQKDRWGFDVPMLGRVSPGALLHGSLHDKMTPLMAVPGAGLSRMLRPATSFGGKVVNGMLGGGVSGLMTEALRPAMTDAELDDDYMQNVMLGLGSGLAIGGLAPLSGSAVSGLGRRLEASIPRTRDKLAGISKVRPEALEVASTKSGMEQLRKNYGKQGDVADDFSRLFDRYYSEQNYPESSRFQENIGKVQTMGDVYPAVEGYRTFRSRAAQETGSNRLLPSAERDAAFLERLAESFDSDVVPGKDPYVLGPGGSRRTGTAMRTAKQIQRNKQDMQAEASSQYNKAQVGSSNRAMREVELAAKKLRNLQREVLIKDGSPEAMQALADMESMARKNRSLEFAQKTLRTGKDLDLMPERTEGAVKGMFQENSTRNARRQKALKMIDKDFGTDFYNRSRYASLADNLAEPGTQVGGAFSLSGTNKHMTGRSLMGVPKFLGGALLGHTPRGAVRRLRGEQALAEGLQSLSELMQTGYSPFYQRPASEPVKLSEDERKKGKANAKGKGEVSVGDLVMEDQGSSLDYMIPGVGGIVRKRTYVK